jgi:Protein of unknown function (DUF3237)
MIVFSGPIPVEPKLQFALTIAINLKPALWVRPSQYGSERAGVYVKDGTVSGPDINGIVIPDSGADWPWLRPDGVIDFDARYMLMTDDGAVIYMQNRGYRWGSKEVMAKMARREPVPDDSYYMRVVPKFEAPAGKYDWMNKYVFVGRAEKQPESNRIHYFKVL